jgi:hypothetical protein
MIEPTAATKRPLWVGNKNIQAAFRRSTAHQPSRFAFIGAIM